MNPFHPLWFAVNEFLSQSTTAQYGFLMLCLVEILNSYFEFLI
ncbi:hypothetical protein D028_2709 [Vibrio parahaemolyticus 50]|nr:hypothetical protein D028_2709 [Vibrio parahaemolyticus 50]